MRKSLLILSGVALVQGLLINGLLDDPTFDRKSDEIEYLKKSNQPEKLVSLRRALLDDEPNNLDYHYDYIESHFRLPEMVSSGSSEHDRRDDRGITTFYQNKLLSPNLEESDIGQYGLGLIHVNLKQYEAAKENFLLVQNKKLKYLNNSLGNVYRKLKQDSLAQIYFLKALEYQGNVWGATSNISRLYLDQKELTALNDLIIKDQNDGFISVSVLRKFYLLQGQYLPYFKVLLSTLFRNLNWIGLVGAILILSVWVVYLRKLDIYEPEQWKPHFSRYFLECALLF